MESHRYDTAIRAKAARYASTSAVPPPPPPSRSASQINLGLNLGLNPRTPQVRQSHAASRPSSANTQQRPQPDLLGAGDVGKHLRRVQSASILRREQRRAASVEAAISAVARPASANRNNRSSAASAASLQASNIRAAAYAPSEVVSSVPSEHRVSSKLPIFTGHLLPAADRDHSFTLHDDSVMALHDLATGRPRSAKATTAGGKIV